MSAEGLRILDAYGAEDMRAINEVIHAAERLEAPELPEVPDWSKSPANFENGEERTLEEAEALGLEWQQLAVKLHDLLEGIDLEDFEEELGELHKKAKAAREAMLSQGTYQAPYPRRA